MAGTKAGAVKARTTKAKAVGGLKLRDASKRKGVKKRKSSSASFGMFKGIKPKKGKKHGMGPKAKDKRSDQQKRQAVPDPMLFEVNNEATRKIEGLAHEYKSAAQAYSKASDEVKRLRSSLIDAVKATGMKPSPKDGSYKIHAGDTVVTVTPSDEKVKVVLDEDATEE